MMADRHHATTLSSHTHWDKSRRLVLHSYAELKKVFLPREFQLKTNRELKLEVKITREDPNLMFALLGFVILSGFCALATWYTKKIIIKLSSQFHVDQSSAILGLDLVHVSKDNAGL